MLRRGCRIALLAALGVCAAAPAQAGTYAVSACRLPSGAAAPTDGWTPSEFIGTPVDAESRDECRAASRAMVTRLIPPSGASTGTWAYATGGS